MNESKIQKEIMDYLKEKHYYVIKVVRANVGGVPDILACKDGKFFAVEVKAKGKKATVTELQKYHLDLIKRTGGKAIVADSVYDLIEEGF